MKRKPVAQPNNPVAPLDEMRLAVRVIKPMLGMLDGASLRFFLLSMIERSFGLYVSLTERANLGPSVSLEKALDTYWALATSSDGSKPWPARKLASLQKIFNQALKKLENVDDFQGFGIVTAWLEMNQRFLLIVGQIDPVENVERAAFIWQWTRNLTMYPYVARFQKDGDVAWALKTPLTSAELMEQWYCFAWMQLNNMAESVTHNAYRQRATNQRWRVQLDTEATKEDLARPNP